MSNLHISQIEKKAATILANANLVDDWYHNNIKDAARIRAKDGFGGDVYGGQYSGGSTWWMTPGEASEILGGIYFV